MLNIEAGLIAFLNAQLDVPVSADVPKTRPERFVTIERTGGPRDTFRDLPSIAAQAWAEDRYQASELCIRLADAIELFVYETGVAKVEIGSSYNFPDPDSKQSRYQVTASFVTKG